MVLPQTDEVRIDSPSAGPADWFTFLRQFLRDPRATASIAPSGRKLGALMASAVPAGAQKLIELGAGTGSITQALIRKGIEPENLCIVEMNPALHVLLHNRYPDSEVACGDARNLEELSANWRNRRPCVDAVCSSLGMLSIPEDVRLAIMTAAFNVLRPGGVFIQYTYGLRCPIGTEITGRLGLKYHRGGSAWRNLPPARVFVYRRQAAPTPVPK